MCDEQISNNADSTFIEKKHFSKKMLQKILLIYWMNFVLSPLFFQKHWSFLFTFFVVFFFNFTLFSCRSFHCGFLFIDRKKATKRSSHLYVEDWVAVGVTLKAADFLSQRTQFWRLAWALYEVFCLFWG